MRSDGWARGERAGAAVFSAAVLGAMLWPLAEYRRPLKERVDGFPLSWYPMFSARRPRKAGVNYAVGVRADGSRRYLPSAALGPAGINQVRRQLNRVVREGGIENHAAAIAARVALRSGLRDVEHIEIVRGRFDLDRCFLDREVRGGETVLVSALVPRDAARAARMLLHDAAVTQVGAAGTGAAATGAAGAGG